MKAIHEYNDFRKLLLEAYNHLKSENDTFSYKKFSNSAGIKSPNYLKLIIDGDRNLTVTNIHQFAKALKLTEAETDYFESLVLENQASTAIEKSFYAKRLLSLKKNKVAKQSKLKISHIGRYPFLPAILISCNHLEEKSAAAILAKRFKQPVKDVSTIIDMLLSEKLLESEQGLLKLTHDYSIQYDSLQTNSDQKEFLSAQLELSQKALVKRYSKGAQFFAHTLTTKAERIPLITQKIAVLLEEITSEANDDAHEKTLQINIQSFTLEEN